MGLSIMLICASLISARKGIPKADLQVLQIGVSGSAAVGEPDPLVVEGLGRQRLAGWEVGAADLEGGRPFGQS